MIRARATTRLVVHVYMLTATSMIQVDELDLTKPKATELLKANEGDAVKALKAFIAV